MENKQYQATERGILKIETNRNALLVELTPQYSSDHVPSSPQPSVDRLSVTWADSERGMAVPAGNIYHPPSENTINNNEGDELSEEEEYSARLSAVIRQRRASVRRTRKARTRRPSSPLPDDRRRSSVFTTSSGDTAISMEEVTEAVSQEQILETIHLHKEVLGTVRQQPLQLRRKLKIVNQAKSYIKRHEGQLQERLAQSKSTKDIYARFNILLAAKWQQLRREAANMSNLMIPWELRIKEIESHFGSVVASYFTFLRWLFWVNFVIAFILLVFVIVPEYLTENPQQDGERKIIPEEQRRNATNLLILWEFEGLLKYSAIFYGYYSNIDRPQYKMPLAYFLTGLAVYIYSFVATLRKMAENSRMSKLSEKEDECIFSWKLFTGWDFMIGNAETAHNRIASVILGFKEALLEEAEKKKDLRNWRVISLRALVNICVVVLLAVSAYAVVKVVSHSDDDSKMHSWWRENQTTIVVTVISITFPVLFELLGLMEHYHPRKQLRLQLARIMILNLLNLFSLIFALFSKIGGMSIELDKLQPSVNMMVIPETLNNSMESNETIHMNISTICSDVRVPCLPCELIIHLPISSILTTVAMTSFAPLLKTSLTNSNDDIESADNHIQILNNIPAEHLMQLSKNTILDFDTTTDNTLNILKKQMEILRKIANRNETDEKDYEETVDYRIEEFSTPDTMSQEFYFQNSNSTTSDVTEITDFTITWQTSDKTAFSDTEETSPEVSSLTESSTEVYTTMPSLYTKFDKNMTFHSDENSDYETTLAPSNGLSKYNMCPDITFICNISCGGINITQIYIISNCTVIKKYCVVQKCIINNDSYANYANKGNVTNVTVSDILYFDKNNRKMYNLSIETKRKLLKLCWETMFGQELVKLTMMDLVFVLLGTLVMDFFRALFVRYLNKWWCWDLEKKFPEYGDFKIAENILHLINNQGMVWMGMFFSPGLVVLNVFKLVIMMYLRSWAVMTCNVPHEVVFRVSKSNNFYLALLLTMLFLCVLPVGYSIVWVKPSWHCGPFSEYEKIYHIITNNIYKILPTSLYFALEYITSPAIVIPLLVLLILIIYYLTSLTNSLREANNDLKIQLRRERTEERRKMFQLAHTRRKGGSSAIESTTFARWKKALPALPFAKSIDSDDRKDITSEASGVNQRKNKKDNIFAKIVGLAIDKKSEVETKPDSNMSLSPNFDEETDSVFHESLPKEILNMQNITIANKPEKEKKRPNVEFSAIQEVKQKLKSIKNIKDIVNLSMKPDGTRGIIKFENKKPKDKFDDEADSKEVVHEKIKIDSGKVHECSDRKLTRKRTSESSTHSKNSDSLSSVIPVITISTTESDDETLQCKEHGDENVPKRLDEVPSTSSQSTKKSTPDSKILQRQLNVDGVHEDYSSEKEKVNED